MGNFKIVTGFFILCMMRIPASHNNNIMNNSTEDISRNQACVPKNTQLNFKNILVPFATRTILLISSR